MVKTLPPAGSTSPILAMRYWMRPVARRDERIVGDVDLVEFDVVGGGVERALGLADAIVRRVERGDGAIEGLPALVEQFVGGEAARDQRAGAVELLLRERDLGRLLLDVGARLIEALLRLLDLRLGLSKRRLEIPACPCGRAPEPALTMSPSSASISAMRPANLVSMSISSASILPLPNAIPGGNCDCDCRQT